MAFVALCDFFRLNIQKGEKGRNKMKSKIDTSKSLTEEMNEERIRQGKDELPEINPLRGGTSTLARKDKSWSSVPDFFAKAFKKK